MFSNSLKILTKLGNFGRGSEQVLWRRQCEADACGEKVKKISELDVI